MDPYNPLWQYIAEQNKAELLLSFEEIRRILGFPVNHAFFTGEKSTAELRLLCEKDFHESGNRAVSENRKRGLSMNIRIEHKNELTFIGFSTVIPPEEGAEKCPAFWDTEYNQKYARLWQTMQPQNAVEAALLQYRIGMYALSTCVGNGFRYMIAGEYTGGEVPEGLELFTFPESDWAVLTDKGPLPQSIQNLSMKVWNDWYADHKDAYDLPGRNMVEVYSAGNPQSPDYEVGVWVPVARKK